MRKLEMDLDVAYYYGLGKSAGVQGLSPDSCPFDYGNIKAFCAWMGGYNDHKTTRKQP